MWKGTRDKKKQALIKWEKNCRPKEYGGLGIKNCNCKNEALGEKLIWRKFKEHNSKWAKILYHKFLNNTNPLYLFRTKSPPKGSRI